MGDIIVSDLEKTIIDCLHLLRESAGLKEVFYAVGKVWKKVDKDKLFDYLIRFDSTAVIRRLGFILEKNKLKFNHDLSKLTGKGYTLLDPARIKTANYDKKWHIIVNWSDNNDIN